MKRKKYILLRTRAYYPVIAVLGGKHHTDYMPVSYATTIIPEKRKTRVNTKGVGKTLVRNKETFNTQKY